MNDERFELIKSDLLTDVSLILGGGANTKLGHWFYKDILSDGSRLLQIKHVEYLLKFIVLTLFEVAEVKACLCERNEFYLALFSLVELVE